MQRLNFSIRFLNTSFMRWLFMDETTCTTYMNRRNHMRKRSSRPRAIAITVKKLIFGELLDIMEPSDLKYFLKI